MASGCKYVNNFSLTTSSVFIKGFFKLFIVDLILLICGALVNLKYRPRVLRLKYMFCYCSVSK